MMSPEFSLLLLTAIILAFMHTITGPDHYLPFIVISKARDWSIRKTVWFTIACGLGHVGSSILLGFIGISFGIALHRLELFEEMRGTVISWVFTAFGLVYLIWGFYRIQRKKKHRHIHYHADGQMHIHEHDHLKDHLHVHESTDKKNITPWILFTIFVFGPCEPLIPIVMYPAAQNHFMELALVTTAFSVVTIVTMVSVVLLSIWGFRLIPMRSLDRYAHVLAGGTIFLCGIGMVFLGL